MLSCAGLSFTYQLMYLLDATGFYSLGLQALGVRVVELQGKNWYPLLLLFSFMKFILCMIGVNRRPLNRTSYSGDTIVLVSALFPRFDRLCSELFCQ